MESTVCTVTEVLRTGEGRRCCGERRREWGALMDRLSLKATGAMARASSSGLGSFTLGVQRQFPRHNDQQSNMGVHDLYFLWKNAGLAFTDSTYA